MTSPFEQIFQDLRAQEYDRWKSALKAQVRCAIAELEDGDEQAALDRLRALVGEPAGLHTTQAGAQSPADTDTTRGERSGDE